MLELRRLDLQTKIVLVLIAVIVPTFLVVTIVQYQLTRPILHAEMQQIGITTAQALVTKLQSQHLLNHPAAIPPGPNPAIEAMIQDELYLQPSVVRVDVYGRDAATGLAKPLASNVEDDPANPSPVPALIDQITSEIRHDEEGSSYWEIRVPVHSSTRPLSKIIGMVSVTVSNKTLNRLAGIFWKITGCAALVSVVILIFTLHFFLRKTITDERRLRLAENQNIQLSEQLHETQRQLMNVEKLAVMGQLTANFAHEIGTPLNAIGGHLQLLHEEIEPQLREAAAGGRGRSGERFEIISGELLRIEKIVKGFLQTTAKPVSQRQLVDVNQLVSRTLEIARPQLEELPIEVDCQLDRGLGPLRVVPIDIEQILLNLINNAVDSLRAKLRRNERSRLQLVLSTSMSRREGAEWAEVAVYDTGTGIAKEDLKNVTKPFFTTKPPGEGTGLGLNICQQLAGKYGGVLELDSKEGSWAKVMLRIPYRTNA
jgi:signal transduction histidine kinase